jgi:hypothetical protein
VQRFLRKQRGTQTPEARVVIVTAPGQEAQVDYGTSPIVRDPREPQVPAHPAVRDDAGLQSQVGSSADVPLQCSRKRSDPLHRWTPYGGERSHVTASGVSERRFQNLDEVYLKRPDRTAPDPLALADLKAGWQDVTARLTDALEVHARRVDSEAYRSVKCGICERTEPKPYGGCTQSHQSYLVPPGAGSALMDRIVDP